MKNASSGWVGMTVIVLAAVVAAAQAPRGQTAAGASDAVAGARVAVVDLEGVNRAWSASLGEGVDEYRARRIAELDRKRDEVRALQKRILEGGDTLAPETREELIQAVRKGQAEIREAETAAQRDVQARSALQQTAVRDHVKKVAAARGLVLVVDRQAAAVLWHAPSIDITADVLASLKQVIRASLD